MIIAPRQRNLDASRANASAATESGLQTHPLNFLQSAASASSRRVRATNPDPWRSHSWLRTKYENAPARPESLPAAGSTAVAPALLPFVVIQSPSREAGRVKDLSPPSVATTRSQFPATSL
jgi:hypothetical protein